MFNKWINKTSFPSNGFQYIKLSFWQWKMFWLINYLFLRGLSVLVQNKRSVQETYFFAIPSMIYLLLLKGWNYCWDVSTSPDSHKGSSVAFIVYKVSRLKTINGIIELPVRSVKSCWCVIEIFLFWNFKLWEIFIALLPVKFTSQWNVLSLLMACSKKKICLKTCLNLHL